MIPPKVDIPDELTRPVTFPVTFPAIEVNVAPVPDIFPINVVAVIIPDAFISVSYTHLRAHET